MTARRSLHTVGKPRRLNRDSSAWVERTLEKLTLHEKIAQMLMVPFFGGFHSAESAEWKSLLHQVETNNVGGLILHTAQGPLGIKRSQVYPTALVTNELQRRAKIPLLVGADFEFGTRMRLDEGTPLPSPMSIAATGDPGLAYEAGTITALEARAVGVHWVFAPVADLNNNPDNPIINFRSFGEDPREIARFVAAYIRGVEENGALSTAKHFPGHGNVSVDSHLALAAVPGSRSELEKNELVPFRAAIAASVSSIMPGHLAVPAFDSDSQVPATLSRRILTALLREKMKFEGLIVTDAMDMGGVATLFPPAEAAARAVEAGADVVLMPPVPDAALASIEEAVRTGRISVAQIDASVRRILAAKARLNLNQGREVDVERLIERFARLEFEQKAQEIADKGVTLVRNEQHILPLDSTRPLRVLLVALSGDRDPCPAETFAPEIQPRVDLLTVLRADTHFSTVEMLKLPPPDSYDVVIAAIFVRVADRKGHVGFPDEQRAFVNRLTDAGKPVAVAAFGSPYLIERFPNAKTWLAAFSTNGVAQKAAARALFGESAIGGKIPVTVPTVATRGAGLSLKANPMSLKPASRDFRDKLAPAFAVLNHGVKERVSPGGVFAVGWRNDLAVYPCGKLTYDVNSKRVHADTIFDVSSLTKVLVTTTAVMMLVEAKQIDLQAPVVRFLPQFACEAKADPNPQWRELITVRMLLLHTAGLAAHREFFTQSKRKHSLLQRVIEEPLVREPGTQMEYSDLGFILLGMIVENLTGESLEVFAQKRIFEPLGMANSQYNPPKNLRARIAPTEKDGVYRKQLVHGNVHDENAWAMGGVAGHAGLFSTAGDLAIFAQMILNGGIYGHRRLLTRATIAQFTARHEIGDSARTLGWDVPCTPSSSGQYFSGRSFGHLGFTGTSLWIDPARDLFVILLTNRVHPSRANNKIRELRPALHDAIVECLGISDAHAANE